MDDRRSPHTSMSGFTTMLKKQAKLKNQKPFEMLCNYVNVQKLIILKYESLP